MEYRIQQKATIWYETTVEADSPEQAVEKVQNGETLDWTPQFEVADFQNEFWWQDENDNEGEINTDE